MTPSPANPLNEHVEAQLIELNHRHLREFLVVLQNFVLLGGDPTLFASRLNQQFEMAYPTTGHANGEDVAVIKRIYEAVSALPYPKGYSVGPHWDRRTRGLTSVALQLRDPRHVVYYAQDGTLSGFDHRLIEEQKTIRQIIAFKLRAIQADYGVYLPQHYALEESEYAIPVSVATVDGKKYSTIFLTHFQFFMRMERYVGAENLHRVMEIGGGYGGLARIFHGNIPNLKYTIVDLMGSIAFIYLYLRLNFPNASIVVVDSAASKSKDFAHADFVLVPVQFMDVVKDLSFDVVINTASMQEMNQPTVDILMNLIENEIDAKYFYSFNYFLSLKQVYSETSGADEAGHANLICPKLDMDWEPVFARLNTPGLTIDANSRNWLEILVKRDREGSSEERAALHFAQSQRLAVMSNAWFSHAVAAALLSKKREYILNFLNGVQMFTMTDCEIPNFIYTNKNPKPGRELREEIFNSLGEVVHFRRLLQDARA